MPREVLESRHVELLKKLGFVPCESVPVVVEATSPEQAKEIAERAEAISQAYRRHIAGRLLYGTVPEMPDTTFVTDEVGNEWRCDKPVDLSYLAEFIAASSLLKVSLQDKYN